MAAKADYGLTKFSTDLSAEALVSAYKQGIFPWPAGERGVPIGWYSPCPRATLSLDPKDWSKTSRRAMRSHNFEVRPDYAAKRVIKTCAATYAQGRHGTWISSEIVEAYSELYDRGWVHTMSVWQDSKLVGGVYGVAVGKLFCGESMFGLVNNASKVALGSLLLQLRAEGFELMDAQITSEHLKRWGLRELKRQEFHRRLRELNVEAAAPSPPWHQLDDYTLNAQRADSATVSTLASHHGQPSAERGR